jgi:hypothetical protein
MNKNEFWSRDEVISNDFFFLKKKRNNINLNYLF